MSTLQKTFGNETTWNINKDLQCYLGRIYSFQNHCFHEKLIIKISLNQVETSTKKWILHFLFNMQMSEKRESIKALSEIISSLKEVHNPCLSLVSRHTIVEKHGCAAICTMMLILLEGLLTWGTRMKRLDEYNLTAAIQFILYVPVLSKKIAGIKFVWIKFVSNATYKRGLSVSKASFSVLSD